MAYLDTQAQLPQRDRATRYVNKFVPSFTTVSRYGSKKTAKMTFKVIQGHWKWCHSISHIRFPISVPLLLRFCLAPLAKYYLFFPKSKEVT